MDNIKPINGKKPHFWWASDLMEQLDYKGFKSFVHYVNNAVRIMIIIDVPYDENVIPIKNSVNGKSVKDYQLSRFVCYLIVMLADRKKERVAEIQDRFIIKTEQYGLHLKDFFELERLKIREELSEASKWLSSRAAKAEVTNFSSFIDAGYQGMYKMNSKQLHEERKLPKNSAQFDYMGRTELAANLFRITLTELEIWTKKVKGQTELEKVHKEVGNGIRNLIKEQLDKFPEQLYKYTDLMQLKKQMKEGYLKMNVKKLNNHLVRKKLK
jgi:DNA-damage-inducible protein D